MLKLKLQYFVHLMWRTDSLEKTLMLGKIEGRRRRGQQRMRWLDGITTWWTWVWASSGSWWWTGKPGVLQSMGSQRVGHDWVTELNWIINYLRLFCDLVFPPLISQIKSKGDPWLMDSRLISMYVCFQGGQGNPLQRSCLKNSMDRETW